MNECLICYEKTSSLIFLKCMHSLCTSCLSKLQKSTCPFCRKTIHKTNKLLPKNTLKRHHIAIRFKQRHKNIFKDNF